MFATYRVDAGSKFSFTDAYQERENIMMSFSHIPIEIRIRYNMIKKFVLVGAREVTLILICNNSGNLKLLSKFVNCISFLFFWTIRSLHTYITVLILYQ